MIIPWLRYNSDILMFICYEKVTMNEVSFLFRRKKNILNMVFSIFSGFFLIKDAATYCSSLLTGVFKKKCFILKHELRCFKNMKCHSFSSMQFYCALLKERTKELSI